MDETESRSKRLKNTTIKYGKETTRLLRRIAQHATEEIDLRIRSLRPAFNDPRKLVFYYTGLSEYLIKNINYNNIKNKVRFEEIDRRMIQRTLMNFYLSLEYMPTTTALYTNVAPYLPPYANIDRFRRILVQMGYCWKRLSEGQKQTTVVVEHPKVRFERYIYLKKITEYRKENRPLCFIGFTERKGDTIIIRQNHKTKKLAKVPSKQYLAYAVKNNKVEFFASYSEFDQNLAEKWLLGNVIPNLEEGSIVVFDDSEFVSQKTCKIPNFDSLRVEMTDWLDFNKVPYEKTMSKSALFTVIEKKTDMHDNIYALDILLKKYGYACIRVPSSISRMSPISLIDCLLTTKGGEAADIILSVTEEIISEYDEHISKEEKKIVKQDHQVECLWDKLVANTMLNDNVIIEIDDYLPELSDSE